MSGFYHGGKKPVGVSFMKLMLCERINTYDVINPEPARFTEEAKQN